MQSTWAVEGVLRIRVSGLGQNIDLSLLDTATVGDLKAKIQVATGLPPPHQKLLFRGRAFLEDGQLATSAGIIDRTKLMLMRSEEGVRDASAAEAILALARDIDALSARELSSRALEELVTQLCCKLDAIEIGDSATLREMRRAQIRRAEGLCKAAD
mgnify:CR=1 FL=1|jgi:hypothetical protein